MYNMYTHVYTCITSIWRRRGSHHTCHIAKDVVNASETSIIFLMLLVRSGDIFDDLFCTTPTVLANCFTAMFSDHCCVLRTYNCCSHNLYRPQYIKATHFVKNFASRSLIQVSPYNLKQDNNCSLDITNA